MANERNDKLSCKTCKLPISGEYVKALGTVWHPEHFLCTACKLPIYESEFAICNHTPYHRSCFSDRFTYQCAICDAYLSDRYEENFWGDKYCLRHRGQARQCQFCSRFFEGAACMECKRTGITDKRIGQKIFAALIIELQRHDGLVLPRPITPEVLELSKSQSLSAKNFGRPHLGLTSFQIEQTPWKQRITVECISLAIGMPHVLFPAVLAHELGHVWIKANQIIIDDQRMEEGFCDMLSYRQLLRQETTESRVYGRLIAENADPVYGAGFRIIYELAERCGFDSMVNAMLRNKSFTA